MDNLLVYLVQSYNIEALRILVEKYKKSIPTWTYEVISSLDYNKDIDIKLINDDLERIIYKIIETYDPSKGVFYTYLKGAVHNVIMNHVRQNHKSNAYTLSLEKEIEDNLLLQDSLSSYDNISKIEERYYLIEEIEELFIKINKLKKEDQDILYLRMQGYGCEEIANMTNTNIRKVNYLSRKIKKM